MTTINTAILDAIDVYCVVQMVNRMMERAGRGDEPRSWPSVHRLSCAAFVESLRENGYELCVVGENTVVEQE